MNALRNILLTVFAVAVAVSVIGSRPCGAETLGPWLSTLTKPVEVTITARRDDLVDLAGAGGELHEGERLNVFRLGDFFKHPVTGAVMGRLQTEVGRIELVSSESGLKGRILRGTPEPGDLARMTAAPLKLVLTYPPTTSPVVLDQLFRELRAQNRFEVRDGGGIQDEASAPSKARSDEDLALYVQVSGGTLHGKLFWVEDGKAWANTTVAPSEPGPGTASPAGAGTAPAGAPQTPEALPYDIHRQEGAPWVNFPLPHAGFLLATGDLDGDGSAELIVYQGDRFMIYRPERLEMNPVGTISVAGAGGPFAVGVADLNGNGRGEIFLTHIHPEGGINTDTGRREGDSRAGRPSVLVMERGESGGYRTLWSADDLFVRVVDGIVYAQAYGNEGSAAPIKFLAAAPTGYALDRDANVVPPGVGLYDFVPLPDGALFYTADGRCTRTNETGGVVWTTETTFGNSRFSYLRADSRYSAPARVTKNIPPATDEAGRMAFVTRNFSVSGVLTNPVGIRASEIYALDLSTGTIILRAGEGNLGGEIRDLIRLPDGRIAALLAPILGSDTTLFSRWDYFTGKSALVVIDPARI